MRPNKIDCAIGGGRRDEEKARAKERFFSHRDDFGQWDPKNQRPELWNIFNGKYFEGEHFRVFPISNWTEMDVWNYIQREQIEIPSLYIAHEREVVWRNNSWIPNSEFLITGERKVIVTKKIRFRTFGDITITGGIESDADTLEKIVKKFLPCGRLNGATEQMTNVQKMPWKTEKNKDIFKTINRSIYEY